MIVNEKNLALHVKRHNMAEALLDVYVNVNCKPFSVCERTCFFDRFCKCNRPDPTEI
ncbi:MAG: hypothetical protein RIT26_2163 [Pseudomonadota bacterium]|jgi:hypothetical protein